MKEPESRMEDSKPKQEKPESKMDGSKPKKRKSKPKFEEISQEVFTKIDDLLKDHGLVNYKLNSIKLESINEGITSCPPGKTLFCDFDVMGNKRCICLKLRKR